ncbi:hypothetical protein ACLKA6_004448 [Drosophila palustris]
MAIMALRHQYSQSATGSKWQMWQHEGIKSDSENGNGKWNGGKVDSLVEMLIPCSQGDRRVVLKCNKTHVLEVEHIRRLRCSSCAWTACGLAPNDLKPEGSRPR